MAPATGRNRELVPVQAPDAVAKAVEEAAAASAAGGAGKQASDIENMLLAKAWIATSENPTVSTDQTGNHFHLTFSTTYWKMAREFVQAKKPLYERISLDRAESFPKAQFARIRQATYILLSVRRKWPRTSGDTNIQEYYKRIRPKFAETLKDKNQAHTNCDRYEAVADYLHGKPKFMSYMDKKSVERPKGKRAMLQQQQLQAAKKHVMESEGAVNGNLSVLDGGAGTAQGAAAMAAILDQAAAQNQQMMAHAMYQQQLAQQQQNRAMIIAMNPDALAAYDQANPPVAYMPPFPMLASQGAAAAPPPPPPAGRHNLDDSEEDEEEDQT